MYDTHTYTYRCGSPGVSFKSGGGQGVQPRCGPHGLTFGPCVRVSHCESEDDTQPCLRGSGEDGIDTCQAMPTMASSHSGLISYASQHRLPCPALGRCIPRPECVAGGGYMPCPLSAALVGLRGSRPRLGGGQKA